jgi:hypothetical protein
MHWQIIVNRPILRIVVPWSGLHNGLRNNSLERQNIEETTNAEISD